MVGAGAAGLMTALSAARADTSRRLKILLLDTRERIGAKILISGGTRCNVTNARVRATDYEGGPRHFIGHVLEAFNPEKTHRFFEAIGVELVLEPSGKYFPVTHSGKTVLEALMREIGRLSVILKTGVRITGIKKKEGLFYLEGSAGQGKAPYQVTSRRVVLTTGGLSYPETGSDGAGFLIAKDFGHTLVPTSPALTPLTTIDEDWKSLSGVSLEAKLSFFKNGGKKVETTGPLLFTHFGFSGPAALDISRHFTRAASGESPEIKVSFLPGETEENLIKRFQSYALKRPEKSVKNFFAEEFLWPERFAEVFLKKIGLEKQVTMRQGSRLKYRPWLHAVLNYPLEVTGVVGYKKAEVTAGGVDLREITVSTMESKRVPGLYFAGEICDVDGRIGGFNFQWSWSSGALAGYRAVKSLA